MSALTVTLGADITPVNTTRNSLDPLILTAKQDP